MVESGKIKMGIGALSIIIGLLNVFYSCDIMAQGLERKLGKVDTDLFDPAIWATGGGRCSTKAITGCADQDKAVELLFKRDIKYKDSTSTFQDLFGVLGGMTLSICGVLVLVFALGKGNNRDLTSGHIFALACFSLAVWAIFVAHPTLIYGPDFQTIEDVSTDSLSEKDKMKLWEATPFVKNCYSTEYNSTTKSAAVMTKKNERCAPGGMAVWRNIWQVSGLVLSLAIVVFSSFLDDQGSANNVVVVVGQQMEAK